MKLETLLKGLIIFNENSKVFVDTSRLFLRENCLEINCNAKIVSPITGISFKKIASEWPEWKIEEILIRSQAEDFIITA